METAASFAPAAWLITGAAVLISAGLGAALSYHWFQFGMNRTLAISGLVVYTLVSLLFLAVLAALAAAL